MSKEELVLTTSPQYIPKKLHEFTGIINYCWLAKVTSKNEHYQQSFYQLEIEEQSLFGNSSETIYVFANLVSKDLWKTLEQQNYKGKTYTFYCEKRTRGWRLIKWEEVNHEK